MKFSKAKINLEGRTWGAAWADVNGDKLPDLYTSNHQAQGSLLINDGNGGFKKKRDAFPVLNRDTHGAVFGDFDNDGDADLMQVTGSSGGNKNLLYVNDGTGKFTDQATTLGVLSRLNRGRTPLWFDYDIDGDLDLGIFGRSQGNGKGESTIFRNDGNKFTNVSKQIRFKVPESSFGGLADLDNDDQIDFYVKNANKPWLNVYRLGKKLTDINEKLRESGIFYSPKDIASADFNGDLKTDLFFTRNRSSRNESAAHVIKRGRVYARLNAREGDVGIRFDDKDIFIRLFVDLPEQSIEDVLIGRKGIPANKFDLKNVTPKGLAQTEYELRLSIDDPRVKGLSSGKGLFIGLRNGKWSAELRGEDRVANLLVTGDRRFKSVDRVGFENSDFVDEDLLLLNDGKKLEVTEAGLNEVLGSGVSVASGDFDNDMDVDLYILNTTTLSNTENFMFLNNGNGTFSQVKSDRVLRGSKRGRGDTVTTVDYDLDGNLDLFITNGSWPAPLTNDGVQELLRNKGTGNNWLQIDLVGTQSNRDAVGAIAYITTKDGVTQKRTQDGGTHLFSQNYQRLHVGLGKNNVVKKVEIVWPDGARQVQRNIKANQLIEITEGLSSKNQSKNWFTIDTDDGPIDVKTDINTASVVSSKRPIAISEELIDKSDHLQLTNSGFKLFAKADASADRLSSRLDRVARTSVTEREKVVSDVLKIGGDRLNSLVGGKVEFFRSSPNGAPTLNVSTDSGIYLWYDDRADIWQMRALAGGDFNRFTGTISSDADIAWMNSFMLEEGDQVIRAGEQINFDLKVGGRGQDALSFRLQPGASLSLKGEDIFIGPQALQTETNWVDVV